jgi:6-phosphofructokinase 1
MITIQEGHLEPLPFGAFSDPETGRVRTREVDTSSMSYRTACEYMIRLERADLDDPEKLGAIAEAAGITPEQFRERYAYLVG